MSSAEIGEGASTAAFAVDVRRGLTASPKSLDPRCFYDALGSALFGAICELPEYYVTRCERQIIDAYAEDIVATFQSPVARLVELGSGSAQKTRSIIAEILARQPRLLYQPVDVDASMLETTQRDLHSGFATLDVQPFRGDFREVGALGTITGRTVVLFLGSSIGNLDHRAASTLLREASQILAADDSLFVGFDLKKPKAVLEAAYDDALGVTAAFNLNVLGRINRELGGTFALDRFSHHAFYDEAAERIEMHLVSAEAQTVGIDALGLEVHFEKGETIHTENSHKYDDASIAALAFEAGLEIDRRWTDSRGWFVDVLLRPMGE